MLKVQLGKILLDLTIFIPYIFEDFRGCYVETYNEKTYNDIMNERFGHAVKFVQDDISVSSQNVIRGLHGDHNTWKLIQCLKGSFYLVVADMRKDSKTFLKWESFEINEHNRKQVLIPPGFVNGHLCLTDTCIFSYKQSTYYEGAEKQMTVMWDDPRVGIKWPIDTPILSHRDKIAGYLNDK